MDDNNQVLLELLAAEVWADLRIASTVPAVD